MYFYTNKNFKNKQEEAYYNKKHKDFKHPKSNEKFKQFGKLNPVDKNGKISRCVICDSKLHWAPKCPHRNDQNVNILEDSDSDSAENHSFEEANIVLITEDLSKSEIFVTEASKSAVIDTACTKTVAGEQWLNNFMLNLTTRSKNEIKCYPSSTKFKFGDGRQVTAIKRIIFPVVIAGKHCKINAEIVKENIPLLLSKRSLKKCDTIIDMINDKAIIFGNEIELHLSTSGHDCVDIVPKFYIK